jgi:uncharacterized repeat protein (TIGR03803 family)
MDGALSTSLIQARDEKLYGATYYGGAYNLGTSFRIDLHLHNAPLAPSIVSVYASAGDGVRVEWADVLNATTFTIKRGLVSGHETVLATGLRGTSFIDHFVTKGSAVLLRCDRNQ